MADFIQIPRLNPLRLFENTKGVFAIDLLPNHEVKAEYVQKYQNDDYLNLQFKAIGITMTAADDTITARLIDVNLTTIKSFTVIKKLSFVVSVYDTYEILDDFGTVPEGAYWLELNFIKPTKTVTFYSEPIYVKTIHEGTMLIKYFNDENAFDVIFDDNYSALINFYLRIEGGFNSDGYTPGAKDTIYTNQKFDKNQLSSVPYCTKKLTFGNSFGLPEWIIDKANRALSCNNFFKDGTQFTKFDGAKLECTRLDKFYPLFIAIIEMIESVNKYSDEIGLSDTNVVLGYSTNALGFDTTALGYTN
ncbi:MAG TPA: hypothetical protein VIK86_01215 [Candidatus Paceibacterota bacterium]